MRRKGPSSANSIWGDLDLSSIAKSIQDEAVPIPDMRDAEEGNEVFPPAASSSPSSAYDATERTADMAQEGSLTAEIDVMADVDVATAEAQPTKLDEPKKRHGRRKKLPSDPTVEDRSLSATTKLRRKPGRAKASGRGKEAAVQGPDAPGHHAAQDPPTAVVDASAPADELEDLLQLDQENQRLRKLLGEKLREENAMLRKRLGLD